MESLDHMSFDGKKVISPCGGVGIVIGKYGFFRSELWVEWVKPSERIVASYRGYGTPFSLISVETFHKWNKETI
jgi:hypothetical protein